MKKYLYYASLLIALLFLSLYTINANNVIPLTGKLIIIDPGHGGADPGTVHGQIYEKNINLRISKLLKKELESYGASVILTREGDYDLSSPNAIYRKKSDFDNRIKLINESKADLYLSIHLNYLSDSSYYWPQVFYKKEDQDLAQSIQKILNKEAASDRDIKLIPEDTYMYKRLIVSGLLIECGFLSNATERLKLNTPNYQQQIAKNISKGLVAYFT